MVRLSQNWVMRYPLMDFHGNNGTILGDGPAAGRYTEARLCKISEDGLLNGLKKKNVDFIPTYDETEEEPVTLPSLFPNLLCNPNEGIGWAMGCSWAPHNLKEVYQAIKDYNEGKEPMLPGPDFPTGGVIINRNDIPKIMQTGHGSVKVRGRYNIEGENIVFYEIPYGTRVEPLMEEIGKACDDEDITGIADIRNETGKNGGLKLTIQVDKNVSPAAIVKQLFAKTDLQSTFSYNQVALVNKTPTELNLKDCIFYYMEHNRDCLKREYNFDLKKAEDRLEIVEGLLKALEDIDNIIALIKASESSAAAKVALIEKYNFTQNQATAIVNMKLGSLAGLEKIELQKENSELNNTINNIKSILGSQEKIDNEIMTRLTAFVNKYGDDRRTILTQEADASDSEKRLAQVEPEDVVVTISNGGNIKRTPKKSFRVQNTAGKGVKIKDSVFASFSTNTLDNLLLFTLTGKMFKLLVDDIPEGNNASKGVPINGLIDIGGEKIIAAVSASQHIDAKYAVFFTKKGIIKKTDIEEYLSVKKSKGIAAIKLKDDDYIVSIAFMNDDEVIVATHDGQAIHFETAEIRSQGRATVGVKAIQLKDNDYVINGFTVKDNGYVGVFTENGKGKLVEVKDFPVQERAGYGVAVAKSPVASCFFTSKGDSILISGSTNSICVTSSDIPVLGRAAMGNMMIQGDIQNAIRI